MALNDIFNKEALDLLKKPIPKFETIHPSLISVLKAHSETNLSNLLAYFFKGEYSLHLQDIFLTSLIEGIVELGKDDNTFLEDLIERGYDNIEVMTEYVTTSGRIDILIIDDRERSSEKSAIIIENKLYHEVNNDFDDYFYSVCNDFNIEPKNIIVVILSLKEYHSDMPSNIKSANLLHKTLKGDIVKCLGNDLNFLYDKTSGLLVGEFLKHIDDLYLDISSYGNENCYEYYAENRIIVNKIVADAKELFKQVFATISEENKKLLFENRTKLEELIKLHEDINNSVNDYFIHYTKLTDRNVQGKDYFRGRGLSYDAIRYKLDFDSHFKTEKTINLEVWLNDKILNENGIDIMSQEIEPFLTKRNIKIPTLKKNQWYKIYNEELEVDETMLNNILKNNIDENWYELEAYLSNEIKKSQIIKFNEKSIEYLKTKRLNCEIKEEQAQFVAFSYSTTAAYIMYSIKCSPPDLIEIILYVNNSVWDVIPENISLNFTQFTEKQSYRIDQLKSVDLGRETDYYDALLKKSYRIKTIDELIPLLEKEREKWIEMEKEILRSIEQYHQNNQDESDLEITED